MSRLEKYRWFIQLSEPTISKAHSA